MLMILVKITLNTLKCANLCTSFLNFIILDLEFENKNITSFKRLITRI